MKKLLSAVLSVALLLLPLAGAAPVSAQQQNPPSSQSFVSGRYVARNYNYTGIRIFSGNTSGAGAATFALSSSSIRLPDGRTIVPFAAGGTNILGQPGPFPAIPITIGAGTTKETVTPTAVTGCYIGAPQGVCQITATFSNAHGQGEVVTSGTDGIQEAINDAAYWGGGIVTVDGSMPFTFGSITSIRSIINATAIPYYGVSIEDTMGGGLIYWNAQGGSTQMTQPTTLSSGTTVTSSTTPVGNFAASAYAVGVACVDVMGQEGQVSATATITPGAGSSSLTFTAPTNCVGAAGYTVYSTLAGASYPLAYKVPITSSVCTLTTIELTVAACAVANTSYGQTASNAVVTAVPANTASIAPESTTISTTSVYVPNPNGRTTYSYVPSSHIALPGTMSGSLPYVISAAAGSTVPAVLGTIDMPPQFMNYVGRTIRVCGKATTTGSTATIAQIQFQWDAAGQNTAGKGVQIGNLGLTPVSAFATTAVYTFCEDFETTVSGAGVTAGSINTVGGFLNTSGVATAAAGQGASSDPTIGTVGSLNLAGEARLNIIYVHTTGSDSPALTLQSATVQEIN